MPDRAPPRMKTERFLSVMGNLKERMERTGVFAMVQARGGADMKGTIRRKRRPPVAHAGLPLIPGRRDQNLSTRCGPIKALATPDAGNTGPHKRLGVKGGPVNRQAIWPGNRSGTGTQNLTRNRQTCRPRED
ncbi:conserved hypothetical protein [Agrobacterium genomosp. 5 str. CFBP 6626]|nr:conserved hypothetical protein [Agrobacterium genomosp. 5 str. CFBP 6626]